MVHYSRNLRAILFHAPDSIPLIYSNFVGGKFDGHYLPQQIALPGSGGMEILRNAFLKIQTNIHYQLTSKQCVYANLNVSAHNDKALKIFDGQYFASANIGYSHLTVVGPLAVEIGYSDLSKKSTCLPGHRTLFLAPSHEVPRCSHILQTAADDRRIGRGT